MRNTFGRRLGMLRMSEDYGLPDGAEFMGTRSCQSCPVVWHMWVPVEDPCNLFARTDPDLSHCPDPHPLDWSKDAKCRYGPIKYGGIFAEMTPGEMRRYWEERVGVEAE